MDLQTRKISFIQEFLRLEDEEIIKRLEDSLRTQKTKRIEHEMHPITKEQLVKETKIALEDSQNDRGQSINDLMNDIEKWI